MRYTAYLRDYSPQWQDYCQHKVSAEFGWEAKDKAIAEHRAKCVTVEGKLL